MTSLRPVAIPVMPIARRSDPATGPVFFSAGFRPFFLLGAAWAAVSVAIWLPVYLGAFELPVAIPAIDWHVHELLYGYLAAVITGFLLTAIPNWTGRLPIAGKPLMALVALWLAGRAAMLCSARLGTPLAAVVDAAFLPTVFAVCLREVVAGRNWRNLRVLAVLALVAAGNILFHYELLENGTSDYGRRWGVAAVIGLIILIGGRIVPSFTRNWLARRGPGRMPAPFSRFDALAIATAAVALTLWVLAPEAQLTSVVMVSAGSMQAFRLVRWAGHRTLADPLVAVLHLGYAFVPLGFFAIARPDFLGPGSIHVWTAGAIGLTTLAVMTRATLGHTGQVLEASIGTRVVFGLALASALCRLTASAVPGLPFLHLAAVCWSAAFGGFVLAYAPLILKPRQRT